VAGGGRACQPDHRALIALVRHPAADVAPGICYGRLDVPVTDQAAVAALVVRLAAFGGTVWSSPAQRCRVVANGLRDPVVDPRLQELDFGEWEGVAWDDVPRAALDAWAADVSGFAPPGGESGSALVARVRAFASALPAGDHVVITHGGPLKVLTAILRGVTVDLLAPAPALGSITLIG
jgi:alpha-ribazole phosphatase